MDEHRKGELALAFLRLRLDRQKIKSIRQVKESDLGNISVRASIPLAELKEFAHRYFKVTHPGAFVIIKRWWGEQPEMFTERDGQIALLLLDFLIESEGIHLCHTLRRFLGNFATENNISFNEVMEFASERVVVYQQKLFAPKQKMDKEVWDS